MSIKCLSGLPTETHVVLLLRPVRRKDLFWTRTRVMHWTISNGIEWNKAVRTYKRILDWPQNVQRNIFHKSHRYYFIITIDTYLRLLALYLGKKLYFFVPAFAKFFYGIICLSCNCVLSWYAGGEGFLIKQWHQTSCTCVELWKHLFNKKIVDWFLHLLLNA